MISGAPKDMGVSPRLSHPGLPLGIYTNHWKKVLPHRSIGGCKSSVRDDNCVGSYDPSEVDYDFQGIFNTKV